MSSIERRIAALVRPEIREMKAYHVADASGMIKLDAMENPYSLPSELSEAWSAVLKQAAINRYPPPHPESLIELISEHFQLPAGQKMMLGNGSDELIQILMLAIASTGRTVMAPEPAFVMYSVLAQLTGMDFIGVKRAADFSLDMDNLLKAIKQHQPELIFLASPNNPTGNLMSRAELENILAIAEGLVVVDEAYYIFSEQDHIDALGQFDNLLLMRTFSKIGLAGLRLGMLMGPKQWLDELHKVRMPYNVNILTQLSTTFFLQHHAILQEQAEMIIAERSRVQEMLAAMDNVSVFTSHANFLCLRLLQKQACDVFNALKDQGILIKNLHGSHALLDNCLRVTIGTAKENDAFLKVFQELMV